MAAALGRRQGPRRHLLRRRLHGQLPRGERRSCGALPDRAPDTRAGPKLIASLTDAELARRIREHAYLEGDFVLRSGKRSRYYLDKYRFETRPDILAALGEKIAARVGEVAPQATRIAGPELGAVALAAAASLSSGLPFLLVRKEAKSYGTENRLEGGFTAGEEVCLVEDVVTSGGAAADAVDALREAGLECHAAICVVDREEGGVDALARKAVRLHALFRAQDILQG